MLPGITSPGVMRMTGMNRIALSCCASFWSHMTQICFLSGYLMANHGLIEKVNRVLPKGHAGRMISCMTGIVAVFLLRMIRNSVYGFLLDVFYAPAFVCFAAALFEACEKKPLHGTFSILGKYSAGMWFFHAVFFSTYICDTFQPILRMVKPPVLMYLWCVALSLAGAYSYQELLNGVKRLGGIRRRPADR